MGISIHHHAPVALLPSEIALSTHGTKGMVGPETVWTFWKGKKGKKIPCPYRESKKGSLVAHVLDQ